MINLFSATCTSVTATFPSARDVPLGSCRRLPLSQWGGLSLGLMAAALENYTPQHRELYPTIKVSERPGGWTHLNINLGRKSRSIIYKLKHCSKHLKSGFIIAAAVSAPAQSPAERDEIFLDLGPSPLWLLCLLCYIPMLAVSSAKQQQSRWMFPNTALVSTGLQRVACSSRPQHCALGLCLDGCWCGDDAAVMRQWRRT